MAGAQVWSTDQFVVQSDIVGQDFLIQVGKPLQPQPGRSSPPRPQLMGAPK